MQGDAGGWRLAGAVAAGVLAVGAVSLSATAGSAATTKASTAAGTANTVGAAVPGRAQVPWTKVGTGWELAEYDAGPAGKTAPVTLYLISPAGVRYSMHTWNGRGVIPYLVAWSGDKTRALLGVLGSQYEQVNLKTGTLTSGKLAGGAEPQGYTLPSGQDILGSHRRSQFRPHDRDGRPLQPGRQAAEGADPRRG